MKISFENPDKINGLMTLTVEEADYKENVEKKLKDYRKKANVPGFRPGMVPMGLIKRQYGTAIKVDEVNKLVGENIYKYVQENNIAMLGEPMPSDKQVEQDLESDGPFTFVFDIAVAPDFKIELTNKDKINYYNIDVDDKLIDEQVESFAARAGHYDKVEAYDPELRDMLKGDLREQEKKGKDKEDGITVSDAVLMPQYIKVDKQKKLFEGCKVGDIITFNLDEYCGIPKDHEQSYWTFMHENLFNELDCPEENIHVPAGNLEDEEQACIDYETELAKYTVDVQVLGIGSDGHIAFNEPGTPFDSLTHLMELTEQTRRDNARFFLDENGQPDMDQVPKFAITQGLASIMRAKKIIMIATGLNKADAVYGMLKGPKTEDCPASILQDHPEVYVFLDKDAASKL